MFRIDPRGLVRIKKTADGLQSLKCAIGIEQKKSSLGLPFCRRDRRETWEEKGRVVPVPGNGAHIFTSLNGRFIDVSRLTGSFFFCLHATFWCNTGLLFPCARICRIILMSQATRTIGVY